MSKFISHNEKVKSLIEKSLQISSIKINDSGKKGDYDRVRYVEYSVSPFLDDKFIDYFSSICADLISKSFAFDAIYFPSVKFLPMVPRIISKLKCIFNRETTIYIKDGDYIHVAKSDSIKFDLEQKDISFNRKKVLLIVETLISENDILIPKSLIVDNGGVCSGSIVLFDFQEKMLKFPMSVQYYLFISSYSTIISLINFGELISYFNENGDEYNIVDKLKKYYEKFCSS